MDSGSSADWSRLDRVLQKATDTFRLAAVEEDFQMVGLLCREAFISLAQTIYDGSRHQTVDGVVPSITDSKRMLEAFFAVDLPGASNEASRRHARAAVSLADSLVHRRIASYRDAALCLEATTSTVNLAFILTGRAGKERILPVVLPIRPIKFPFPEFQAARRVKHLTLVVAGYLLVTLTGVSADAGFPRRRHS
jgi:hypothetical protein